MYHNQVLSVGLGIEIVQPSCVGGVSGSTTGTGVKENTRTVEEYGNRKSKKKAEVHDPKRF